MRRNPPQGSSDRAKPVTDRDSTDDSIDSDWSSQLLHRARVHDDPEAVAFFAETTPALLDPAKYPLQVQLGRIVVWGVKEGRVGLDEDGLAYVRSAPDAMEAEPSSTDHDTTPPDQLPLSRDQSLAVLRAAFDLIEADHRRAGDLRFALRTGFGQRVALEALDVELVDPGPFVAAASQHLGRRLGLIAQETTTSKLVEDVRPILGEWMRLRRGTDVPLWFYVLVHVFERPVPAGNAAECAEYYASSLCLSAPDAPEQFARRDPEHMRQAERLVAGMAVRTLADIDELDYAAYAPQTRTRGRAVEPWTAAARFAACFGIHIPKRARDAARRKRA